MDFLKNYLMENYVTLVLLFGLIVLLVPKTPFSQSTKKLIYALAGILLVLSFVDYAEMSLSRLKYPTHSQYQWRTLFASIGYILRPLMIIVPTGSLTRNKRFFWMMTSLQAGNVLVYCINWFVPIAFWFDQNNSFQRGSFSFFPHFISIVYLIYFITVIIDQYGKGRKNDSIVYYLFFVVIVALAITSITVNSVNSTILDPTIAVVILYFYAYLQMQMMQNYSELQKQDLTNARDALLASQIQPHFLYNTLNTIYYLCKTDPGLAADTVNHFSSYLRGNMEMGKNPDQMISIVDDVSHSKAYSDIESLRFDNIKVDYLLEDTDFMIPAITVQPMVENAVKHGVRNKENGHILIRSRETDDNHIVEIIDNGIGYVREKQGDMKHTGMGISNVRKRIEVMTGGTLKLNMVKGQGTTVTITIPKY